MQSSYDIVLEKGQFTLLKSQYNGLYCITWLGQFEQWIKTKKEPNAVNQFNIYVNKRIN